MKTNRFDNLSCLAKKQKNKKNKKQKTKQNKKKKKGEKEKQTQTKTYFIILAHYFTTYHLSDVLYYNFIH